MIDLSLRHEPMGPHFDKWHIDGMPFATVLHRFNAPDLGDPHDHPWDFTSHILKGGYIEEIFSPKWHPHTVTITRKTGEHFYIHAGHIHRIIKLLDDEECWTIIQPKGEQTRTWGFYQPREDGLYHRFHHDPEFKLLGR